MNILLNIINYYYNYLFEQNDLHQPRDERKRTPATLTSPFDRKRIWPNSRRGPAQNRNREGRRGRAGEGREARGSTGQDDHLRGRPDGLPQRDLAVGRKHPRGSFGKKNVAFATGFNTDDFLVIKN